MIVHIHVHFEESLGIFRPYITIYHWAYTDHRGHTGHNWMYRFRAYMYFLNNTHFCKIKKSAISNMVLGERLHDYLKG